jgi:hypothetical protein
MASRNATMPSYIICMGWDHDDGMMGWLFFFLGCFVSTILIFKIYITVLGS